MSVSPKRIVTAGDADTISTPLDTMASYLAEFTVMTAGQRVLCTLFAASTHCFQEWDATPRLYFCSERPGSGKTAAARVVLGMSINPLSASYISAAALYGSIDDAGGQITVFVDEADQVFGKTGRATSARGVLLQILNAGYLKGSNAVVSRGGKAVRMPIFSPVIMAGMGRLPEALQSRAVAIPMLPAVPKSAYLESRHDALLRIAGDQCAVWLGEKATRLALLQAPDLAPVDGSPRFQQVLAPLNAIALAAGWQSEFLAAVTELQDNHSKSAVDQSQDMVDALSECWPDDALILSGPKVHRAAEAARRRLVLPDTGHSRMSRGRWVAR